MPNIAIVGAQWGDEGKGKIVDLLSDRFDVVARFQGGGFISLDLQTEVNITDGWRTNQPSVRAWHREMAEYLRHIDPQRHIITSSYAGIEDDADDD